MKQISFLLTMYMVIVAFTPLLAQEITYNSPETFPKGLVMLFPDAVSKQDNSVVNGNYFAVTGIDKLIDLYGFNTSKKKGEKEIEPEISYYENNVVVRKNKLNLETPKGKATLMGMSSLDNKSIVLLRQTDEEYNRCYYQYYDKTCTPESGPVLLSERKLTEGVRGIFFSLVSENQQFICLEYIQINMKDINSREITFDIMDRDLKSIDKGDYSSIGIKPEENISNRILCNDGSLLIGIGYQHLNDKGKPTNKLERFKVYMQHFEKLSIWEYKIPCTGVSNIEMFVSEKNNSMLYLAGIGSEAESKTAFYAQYDLIAKKELLQVKNKVQFDTFMYEPKKFVQQDKGVVFVMERVYGGASTTMSMNAGSASTTPKDYFNTVLCFKVEEGSETVPWNTIIDKEQVFITSLGLSQFGSIRVVNSDENCFIFFNDNTANYNEQGEYIATEKTLNKFDGKQEKKLWLDDKGLAMVELNLNDGSTKRQLIVRNKGIVNLLSDKCFVADPNGHSATFFIQKNELGQIGLIRF